MFDLKIYFTGVMLFVTDDKQMHVLMPQTPEVIPAPVLRPHSSGSQEVEHDDCRMVQGQGAEHPVEPHVARITFDTAYTRPNATKEDGAIGHVSLRKTRLNIPDAGDDFDPAMPFEVGRVPRRARRDIVDGNDTEVLSGRVHVARGKATGVGKGLCWQVNGELRRLTHQLEWTISGIDGESLDLEMLGLDGLGLAGSGVPTLFPIEKTIRLFIWHAPPFEIPPGGLAPAKPHPGDLNHHFSHLDVLLEPARMGEVQGIPMPVLIGDDCPSAPGKTTDGSLDENRGRDADRGGLTLTCTPGHASAA